MTKIAKISLPDEDEWEASRGNKTDPFSTRATAEVRTFAMSNRTCLKRRARNINDVDSTEVAKRVVVASPEKSSSALARVELRRRSLLEAGKHRSSALDIPENSAASMANSRPFTVSLYSPYRVPQQKIAREAVQMYSLREL
jgi:hypothetical protein